MISYWGVDHGDVVSKGLRPFRVKALRAKGKGKGSPTVRVPGVSVNVPKGPDTDRIMRGGINTDRIMRGGPDVLAIMRQGK